MPYVCPSRALLRHQAQREVERGQRPAHDPPHAEEIAQRSGQADPLALGDFGLKHLRELEHRVCPPVRRYFVDVSGYTR